MHSTRLQTLVGSTGQEGSTGHMPPPFSEKVSFPPATLLPLFIQTSDLHILFSISSANDTIIVLRALIHVYDLFSYICCLFFSAYICQSLVVAKRYPIFLAISPSHPPCFATAGSLARLNNSLNQSIHPFVKTSNSPSLSHPYQFQLCQSKWPLLRWTTRTPLVTASTVRLIFNLPATRCSWTRQFQSAHLSINSQQSQQSTLTFAFAF